MTEQLFDKIRIYKNDHPDVSLRSLENKFDVPKSTIGARLKGTNASRLESSHTKLSASQEALLVEKINQYANRGYLMTPANVREMAEIIMDDNDSILGVNWVANFTKRHKDAIIAKYFGYTDRNRVEADIPETREEFYNIVSRYIPTLNIFLLGLTF